MPGIAVDGIKEAANNHNQNMNGNWSPNVNLSPVSQRSAKSNLSSTDGGVVDTSIEKLYENVCDMQSSDQSPSRQSYESYGEESRIDSELRHLVGGEMRELEIMEEDDVVAKPPAPEDSRSSTRSSSSTSSKKSEKLEKIITSTNSNSKSGASSSSPTRKALDATSKLTPRSRLSAEKPPRSDKTAPRRTTSNGGCFSPVRKQQLNNNNSPKAKSKISAAAAASASASVDDQGLDNPSLGPFLLKQARDLISTGDNLPKALEISLRAAKSIEICSKGKPNLDLVMSLHVTAAIYCSLGQYNDAIPVLEHSIQIPAIEEGQEHALAKFAGHMQLGDTYAILGQLENSIQCYTTGLQVQKRALGETDPRVAETCRYLSEAHVQALQFDEAQSLCQMAIDIHRENGGPASLEEAADRRLMGLICETKGDHESALEHLVLASMAMISNGQEVEVAAIDRSIGDTYLSLMRYDEAIFAYQKALTVFKTTKGENHPSVASVFVRLAELHNKIGKFREAKSFSESALRIYEKPLPGIPPEEFASGLTDVSAIYESMNDLDEAIRLLQKALKIYNDAPGQQSTIAGIEAQIGVMHYMLGNYAESYNSFKSAVSKLRASGEKKNAFFGIALNQMGLACVQRYSIEEANELFEEARVVLEQEYGPYHPDTLGVYSNLAGTYDALGRLDDAIKLLEYVVGMREEKLGTANPDVDDEKRRLAELLKEAGRVRNRKGLSLESLLDDNSGTINLRGIKV